jgi:transaldolase
MKPTAMLHELGQSLWLDNLTRGMLDDGTLELYVRELSVTGLTSNPSIFEAAIRSGHYDAALRDAGGAGRAAEELFLELALQDIERAADIFRPVHEATCGVDGWVSLELPPALAYDAEGSIAAARELHARAGRANVFIKIPGTPEGVRAVEESIAAGVPVNVTLLFSREQYLAAAQAYLRGLRRRVQQGLRPDVASVASLFVSRWDTAVAGKVPAELADRLGIAVARRTYRAYRELHEDDRWLALANAGARAQRLLWASTSTKTEGARDVLYVEALAAPHTVNTLPEKTLLAFADHGRLPAPLPRDGGDAEAELAAFTRAGVDLAALALRLQREGAEAFSTSWIRLLAGVAERSAGARVAR